MKWSNEELSALGDDIRTSIQFALEDSSKAKQYEDVSNLLQEAMDVLNEIAEPFEEAYESELKAENDYQLSEYMRSVI